jgi:hypothetical protein
MAGVYNDTNLAWLAGIIDGEGSVCFCRTHKNRNRTPQLVAASTTLDILQHVKSIAGGTIIRKKVYAEHHKPSWTWSLTGPPSLSIMEAILPFMHEPKKIKRAQLLIAGYPSVTRRNGHYSDEELSALRAFEQDFFSLS